MHVPDGFLDAPTSIATGVAAAGALGLALRKARGELDDRTAPMAGLVATFVFAAQMVNFPVGLGTSGHLLGGALAAVLVGPWTGLLAVSVVLIVQALLLADGGITALGTNITLLAIAGVVVGWFVFRGLQRIAPKRLGLVPVFAAAAALVSVPAAALVFVGLYAVGGTAPVPLDGLAAAMLGWHTLIGIGEALITGLVVASVVAVRPDLVYGARPVLRSRELEIRSTTPAPPKAAA
ncbi:MAG TPA: energy-coupling factor ABC transporter permease [Nocardioidaceae bacterium]|nr:energy-coupling factor ABC transporter permease [Nocardioidaceae bacterium]